MSEYDGWDHHDDPGYDHHDDVAPAPDPADAGLGPDDIWTEEPGDEPYPPDHPEPPAEPPAEPDLEPDPEPDPYQPEPPAEPHGDVAPAEVVGADPDAPAEPDDAGAEVFPPALDLGPLPEPVDGFPWIDTGSLAPAGPDHPAAALADPDPQELAGYAAADLPPGADPWAALAGSDDPATAALARFYRPGGAG
jgi:hypothetical protein